MRSGDLRKLRAHFKVRLQYLKTHWDGAVQHSEWFEKLSYDKNLYSLHIATVSNLRILYVLHAHQAWLLCAFAEKNRTKRDSYQRYIPVAQQRLKAILEGENDGKH